MNKTNFFGLVLLLALFSLALSGCFSSDDGSVSSESDEASCTDGVDNDADGKADSLDSDCAQFYNDSLTDDTSSTDSFVAPSRYTYGIQPSSVNETRLQAIYASWLAKHYVENDDQTMARITWDKEDSTVSEGIGYGMLILVAMDPEATRFSRLWNYYQNFLDGNSLMRWKVYGFETAELSGSASDADLDVATALLLGYAKWNNADFLSAAQSLIRNILDGEVNHTNGELVSDSLWLEPGDSWGQKNMVYNPGYIATGPMFLFSSVDTALWTNIRTQNYTLIQNCQNAYTGTVADWCTVSGAQSGSRSHDYGLEAIRMPWRLALDYYWTGSSDAKDVNKLFADYILNLAGSDLDNLSSGYTWEGEAASSGTASTIYMGSYCLAMAQDDSRQSILDDCFGRLLEGTATSYYIQTLQLLYAVTLAGLLPMPSL
ncbi:MAG TPA: glycosyl hydrolase family 8 [Fibrobacteraceae bacterium]|nr:glycosyl hydrolase family 8 [Fibrobacteraceae bacterium]